MTKQDTGQCIRKAWSLSGIQEKKHTLKKIIVAAWLLAE